MANQMIRQDWLACLPGAEKSVPEPLMGSLGRRAVGQRRGMGDIRSFIVSGPGKLIMIALGTAWNVAAIYGIYKFATRK